MTQKTRLLNYLTKHKTINPLESWMQLGIYRLSDTVLKLRKDGHKIVTNSVDVKNQFNEVCTVAEYCFID